MDVKQKMRAGKMERDAEVARRIKALRGDQTQAEFAKQLEVTQPMVSSWEAARELPSSEMYLRLTNAAGLARSSDDCAFFLEQAGIQVEAVASVANTLLERGEVKMDVILPTAENRLKERLGDQKQRVDEGKDVLVPPFEGTEPVPFDVTVPASRVSNLSSTFYEVVATKNIYGRAGHGVRAGDILVLDKREISSYDEILAQKVVVEFKDGPFVGQLAYVSEGATRHLVIGPFDEVPGNWMFHTIPDLRVISSHHTDPNLPKHRQSHDICRYMGLWVTQYGAEAAAEWKRMAEQHRPTTKLVRGTVRRG
jgi:transcriptional regulator with XRE-family HTH domain